MELRELVAGEEIKIFPLPESHPDVWIMFVRLTQAEHQVIWTECGIRPDPKLQTWPQWTKATKRTCLKMTKSWGGFTENGQPLECTDLTKPRLLEKMVRTINPENGEDVRKPIWRLAMDALDRLDEEEEKN